jgi:hypothetical protein
MNKPGIFGASLRFKKPAKRNKSGKRASSIKRLSNGRLLEQPILELAGAVRCHLCGFSVDAKRMHPHMVRFHGAAFSANSF